MIVERIGIDTGHFLIPPRKMMHVYLTLLTETCAPQAYHLNVVQEKQQAKVGIKIQKVSMRSTQRPWID